MTHDAKVVEKCIMNFKSSVHPPTNYFFPAFGSDKLPGVYLSMGISVSNHEQRQHI